VFFYDFLLYYLDEQSTFASISLLPQYSVKANIYVGFYFPHETVLQQEGIFP